MYIRNKWKLGPTKLVLPPIPDEWRGISGCRLETGGFDEEVGPEVFLVILETSQFAEQLCGVRPFQIFCSSGMARTSHGMILFLLFTVRDGQKDIADYELFLNPHRMGTVKLLSGWAQQSHLKVIVVDSDQSSVRDWFEFENNFDIQTVVETLAGTIGHESEGNFQLALKKFIRDYSLEDLKKR